MYSWESGAACYTGTSGCQTGPGPEGGSQDVRRIPGRRAVSAICDGLGAGIGALIGMISDPLHSYSREVWRPHSGSVRAELTLAATRG
jgi:hypothetical protein